MLIRKSVREVAERMGLRLKVSTDKHGSERLDLIVGETVIGCIRPQGTSQLLDPFYVLPVLNVSKEVFA